MSITSPGPSPTKANPYQDWLRLPDNISRPDAYQLLGLRRFEPDAKLINAAYDRQLRALAAVKAHADPVLWRDVSQQVEQARARLLNHSWRTVIDAALCREDMAAGRGLAPADIPASFMVECRCGAQTSGQRTFCGQCGQALWRHCVACKALAAVSQTYCGQCGGNDDELFAAALARHASTLAAARADLERGSYGAASQALWSLATLRDHRFGELAEQAAILYANVDRQLEKAKAESTAALEAARQRLAEHAYEEALSLLSAVPEELRTADHVAMALRASAANSESQHLQRQIRELMGTNQINGLGGLINRLLALRPSDESARQIGAKLAAQCHKRAAKLIAEDRFKLAQQWLDEIPEFAVNDQTALLQDAISEVNWLTNDIRQTPWVDSVLPRLASRLQSMAPHHAEAKFGGAPERLAKARLGSAWHESAIHPLPSPMRLGVPLSEERWDVQSAAPNLQQWRALQTGFEVALGLALQGLGLAACDVNFAERRRSGLSLLDRVMAKKPARRAWGVDMGDFSLKAACLEVREDGRLVIVDWVHDEHQASLKSLDQQNCEVQRRQCLGQLAQRIADSDAKVCVGLPSALFVMRMIRMPVVRSKAGLAAIAQQAKQAFPMGLDQLSWRHHQFPNVDGGAGAATLMLAARTEHAAAPLARCVEAGLKPDVAQAQFLAIHNLLAFEHLSNPCSDRGASALALDIGHVGSTLVIAAPDHVFYRTMPWGGKKSSEAISREFRITWSQAEIVKRDPLRAKSLAKLYAPLELGWRSLLQDTRMSIEAFRRQYPDPRWIAMHGIGGGFRQHGAMRVFNATDSE